jgi:hypothetical protein
VPSYVLVQLSAGAESVGPELLRVKLHRVGIGNETERLILFPAAAFGGVFLQDRDGGR